MNKLVKRIFDLLIASIGLFILVPVFSVISLIILLTMPGPILFRQNRVGLSGKIFSLNKFRTMRVAMNSCSENFDAGDRSRITRFGKLLRRAKLDELPQLINVIKGEMSIVGPRPEVKKWTEVYPEKWAIVLTVRPGITDNASILFRNEEEILNKSINPEETYRNEILPKKLDLYIDYVNNNNFSRDIIIIFQTIKAILFKWK